MLLVFTLLACIQGLPRPRNTESRTLAVSLAVEHVNESRVSSWRARESDADFDPVATVADKIGERVLEHKEFLNQQSFWWLMGVVIVCMGIGVASVEIKERGNGDASSAKDKDDDEAGNVDAQAVCAFIACVVSLQVTMLLWGIAQEFVITNVYGDERNGERVPSVLFLVFANRIVCFAFTGSLIRLVGKPFWISASVWAFPPAVTNALATWCQYESLFYVSFTVQTAAKSAKLLPVILIGSLRGKSYSLLDYAECLVIVTGVMVVGMESGFYLGTAEDLTTVSVSMSLTGMFLLLGLVLFDSLTPHFQDKAFQEDRTMDPLQMTFSMAGFAAVIVGVILLVLGEVPASIGFISRHPEAGLHMFILSAASTLTQFLISYTVKHYGPLVFTLVVTTRQAVAMVFSNILFEHSMDAVAIVAVTLVFGTVIVRTLRSVKSLTGFHSVNGSPMISRLHTLNDDTSVGNLFLCILGIHVLYISYSISQEFLATHTFHGFLFVYPVSNIAFNHTFGAGFSVVMLRSRKMDLWPTGMYLTALPAVTVFVATFFQHQALYCIDFPTQTMMKTIKIIPVMLIGRFLKTRAYTWLDYVEGILITVLVAYFVFDFQLNQVYTVDDIDANETAFLGILLMCGYVVSDSFLSNFEDYVYQRAHLDPAQMLLGMEVISGCVAWATLIVDGQLGPSLMFLRREPEAIMYVVVQAVSSGIGAYTCTLTVRLFGPAVFTLIMMSRQVISLVVSVTIFEHTINAFSTLCLVAVASLILTSSLRRVTQQGAHSRHDDFKLQHKV